MPATDRVVRTSIARPVRRLASASACAWLVACSSNPPPPDWQLGARGAMERALAAQLEGNDRVAVLEFDRARAEIARTGRVDLMARAELMRCAAQVAALQYEPCPGFERLRADAPEAERAYADHLLGTLDAARVPLLPGPQRIAAGPGAGAAADLAALQGITDPLSRLLAAALWLRSGRATPAVMALAADTASAQGWRRPLLAWLGAQKLRAEQAGDNAEAERLRRRISLVLEPSGPR